MLQLSSQLFRGLPFAAPPVGSLRFMPPVTATPWRDVRPATEFGPVCPQTTPQVWPPTQFFSCLPFCKTIIDLPGGQINNPSLEKHYSVMFLPASPSSPSRTLDLPRALLPELKRYKDTVRCGELGAEAPGHRQQQLTQTLIVRLLKTHFFTSILDFEKSIE